MTRLTIDSISHYKTVVEFKKEVLKDLKCIKKIDNYSHLLIYKQKEFILQIFLYFDWKRKSRNKTIHELYGVEEFKYAEKLLKTDNNTKH